MSKFISLFLLSAGLLSATSCTNSSGDQKVKASEVPVAITSDAKLNPDFEAKFGSWLQKDVECFGIVVGYLSDGSTLGKSVKCRVVAIKPDKIKMKTIESVSLLPGEGCDNMGLAYGDTWWEEEGDIFRTREEAETYIREKGWTAK